MALTVLIAVMVIALAAAFFMLTRRDAVATPPGRSSVAEEADGVVSEPVPVNGTAHLSEPERITWTKQFNPKSGSLDHGTRLCLIHDFALLRAPWCIPLLEQACREERDPAHLAAAQRALEVCQRERSMAEFG
jgi:hypothetical protein